MRVIPDPMSWHPNCHYGNTAESYATSRRSRRSLKADNKNPLRSPYLPSQPLSALWPNKRTGHDFSLRAKRPPERVRQTSM